jgi:hypothetical protein
MSNNEEIIYQCGHSFSRESLLPNKLSIINPICKTCRIGKLKGYMDTSSTPLLKSNDSAWINTPRYIEYKNFYYDDDEQLDNEFMDYEFDEEKYKNAFSCKVSLWGLSLIGVIIGIIRTFRSQVN